MLSWDQRLQGECLEVGVDVIWLAEEQLKLWNYEAVSGYRVDIGDIGDINWHRDGCCASQW